MDTLAFLQALWGGRLPSPPSGNRAFFTLWQLQGARPTHRALEDLEALPSIAQDALDLDAQGLEVYFGVGLREGFLGTRLGSEAQVFAWPGLWLDVDIQHPQAHASQKLPPTAEAALGALELVEARSGLSPTILTNSGYGLHAFYLLHQPFVAGSMPGQHDYFKKCLQRFQRQCAAAFTEKGGWGIDNTAKLQQVLRLPGTHNRKLPLQPKVVEVLLDDGPRYTLEQLAGVTIRGAGRPKTTPASAATLRSVVPTSAAEGSSFSEAPRRGPGRPPEKEWWHEVRRRTKRLTNPENRELALLLLEGQPFAEKGGRNNTCNQLVGVMAALCRQVKQDVESQEIYDHFFRTSIENMARLDDDPRNPALAEDVVLNQIERSLADLQEKAEERKLVDDRLRASILSRARGGRACS